MYPSLEDMTIDQLAHNTVAAQNQASAISAGPAGAAVASQGAGLYSGLGLEELLSYGGLDISPRALEQQLGSEIALATRQTGQSYQPLATITQPGNLGVARSEKKEGVRPVVLAKGKDGKIGIAPVAIDNGIFVGCVWKDSPSAMAGLRFGDQLLAINGQSCAGWTAKQAIKCLGKQEGASITLALRDRPFARPVTFQKDSKNQIGCYIKKGAVSDLVKDSSAARNGLLTKHHVLEVNGQNVVGLSDKDIVGVIQSSPVTVTLTIVPSFIYKHLVDKIGFKRIKTYMDHSVPDV
jgi:syntenin-1